jgi:Peptidase S24-like
MPFQPEEFLTPANSSTSTVALCREALRLELAAEVLRNSGELRFRACGHSMLPSIFPRDVLVVRNEPIENVRPGEVVLVSRGSRFYVHRTVCIENRGGRLCLITRGDGLAKEDPAVFESEFLGRIEQLVRRGKQIEVAATPGFAARLVGWAVRHSDLLTSALLQWHLLRTRWEGKAETVASAKYDMAGEGL